MPTQGRGTILCQGNTDEPEACEEGWAVNRNAYLRDRFTEFFEEPGPADSPT